MNWLFKEEPTHYSYDDLAKDRKTSWSGVKNTPNVTGFVGLTSRPSPLRLDEVVGILAPAVQEKKKVETKPAAPNPNIPMPRRRRHPP